MIGCKKKDDEPVAPAPPAVNEEEVITTLILTFTDQENAGNVYELRFADPDGAGGNDPMFTNDPIPSNRAYNVALRLLNESVTPAVELTAEITSEGIDHQFFFQQNGTTPVISYADADANGRPIGLVNNAYTTTAGVGTLTVTLRHMPDKAASGVSDGDITNAGGDTDIEVAFPVTVE